MIEPIYIERISYLLLNIYENSEYYNFECPFCHEGGSTGRKRRGYILKKKGYSFYCHNCSVSHSFKSLLYELDRSLYYQYNSEIKEQTLQQSLDSDIFKDKYKIDDNKSNNSIELLEPLSEKITKYMYPITDSKIAMNYLEERLVPPKNLKFLKFYYNHEKEEIFNNSIVFPFYNRGYGSYYGFQSRRLNNKIFHIELQDPNYPKLYNIFNVDLTKEVYIFEGFFDSLSIDNSVSMNGSDVPTKYLKMIKKPIFVFDNDDTGFKKILKYARIGYSCFIYPENFGHKDFNEYKIHNPSVDTSRIIRDNIYSSEYAIMKAQERQLR